MESQAEHRQHFAVVVRQAERRIGIRRVGDLIPRQLYKRHSDRLARSNVIAATSCCVPEVNRASRVQRRAEPIPQPLLTARHPSPPDVNGRKVFVDEFSGRDPRIAPLNCPPQTHFVIRIHGSLTPRPRGRDVKLFPVRGPKRFRRLSDQNPVYRLALGGVARHRIAVGEMLKVGSENGTANQFETPSFVNARTVAIVPLSSRLPTIDLPFFVIRTRPPAESASSLRLST